MADAGAYDQRMTRDEALTECRRLGEVHPDRATHSWLPRVLEDAEWSVVKVGVPGKQLLVTMQESRPRPPHADDPRPALWRGVGGPFAG